LKILSINDLQQIGGASKASKRIADALGDLGNQIITVSSDGINGKNHKTLFLGRKFEILTSLLPKFVPNIILQKIRNSELEKQFCSILKSEKPDIINVHNLHCASWPLSLVKVALDFAPVVWTLHDCYSFSGRFCPSHTPPPEKLFLNEINNFWNKLKRNPNAQLLAATAPSNWINLQCKKSNWDNRLVQTIKNPVPDTFNMYKNRTSCKKVLGLKEGVTTILFISGNLGARHKGNWIIEEIVTAASEKNIQFLLIGNNSLQAFNSKKVINLNFIQDEITLKIAYNAADLLIHPAPIDNLPNTVAESMSCGTPVLAFKTGGLPEMVISGKSGWLTSDISSDAIIKDFFQIIESADLKELRSNTVKLASNFFDQNKIANEYSNLFRKLTSKSCKKSN
jgi:glycosyltransferase involved in cell wall biosynthesis